MVRRDEFGVGQAGSARVRTIVRPSREASQCQSRGSKGIDDMAKLKTKPTHASVKDFLNQIPDEATRQDCIAIAQIMEEVTGEKPKMWGRSIVGFGTYHYKYDSGREGDWMLTGFSPRMKDLTLYLMMGFEKYPELMKQLGKHSTGKSCLYIKKLSDINIPTLKKLITQSVKDLKAYMAAKVIR